MMVIASNGGERALPEPDDEDALLLRAIAGGDEEAFERLYRRYYKQILTFVARITRRPDQADDIFNEVMYTVWRKAGSFRGASRPSTWIFGIAYRKALKAAAKNRGAPTFALLEEADRPATAAPDRVEALLQRDQVARALTQLPPEQRAVVELTYFQGYTGAEIAEIIACPLGTVKTRMRAAREKLRTALMQLNGGD
ncbi:MAG: RNA polymerase sigma factor [Pseudomonadota bacterium]